MRCPVLTSLAFLSEAQVDCQINANIFSVFSCGLTLFIAGKFDYDVVVIGGGSGGLAFSKEGIGKSKCRLVILNLYE